MKNKQAKTPLKLIPELGPGRVLEQDLGQLAGASEGRSHTIPARAGQVLGARLMAVAVFPAPWLPLPLEGLWGSYVTSRHCTFSFA